MKIAIVGPGAIGSTLAAWLAQVRKIIVCARTPLSRLVVETTGLDPIPWTGCLRHVLL